MRNNQFNRFQKCASILLIALLGLPAISAPASALWSAPSITVTSIAQSGQLATPTPTCATKSAGLLGLGIDIGLGNETLAEISWPLVNGAMSYEAIAVSGANAPLPSASGTSLVAGPLVVRNGLLTNVLNLAVGLLLPISVNQTVYVRAINGQWKSPWSAGIKTKGPEFLQTGIQCG